jgi:hypothetical protein
MVMMLTTTSTMGAVCMRVALVLSMMGVLMRMILMMMGVCMLPGIVSCIDFLNISLERLEPACRCCYLGIMEQTCMQYFIKGDITIIAGYDFGLRLDGTDNLVYAM